MRGLRIAFTADWGYAPVDLEVREITTRAAHVFERMLECHLVEANPGFSDLALAFDAIVALETDLVGMRQRLQADNHAFSPSLAAMIERPWTATEFTDAIVQRKKPVHATL